MVNTLELLMQGLERYPKFTNQMVAESLALLLETGYTKGIFKEKDLPFIGVMAGIIVNQFPHEFSQRGYGVNSLMDSLRTLYNVNSGSQGDLTFDYRLSVFYELMGYNPKNHIDAAFDASILCKFPEYKEVLRTYEKGSVSYFEAVGAVRDIYLHGNIYVFRELQKDRIKDPRAFRIKGKDKFSDFVVYFSSHAAEFESYNLKKANLGIKEALENSPLPNFIPRPWTGVPGFTLQPSFIGINIFA